MFSGAESDEELSSGSEEENVEEEEEEPEEEEDEEDNLSPSQLRKLRAVSWFALNIMNEYTSRGSKSTISLLSPFLVRSWGWPTFKGKNLLL